MSININFPQNPVDGQEYDPGNKIIYIWEEDTNSWTSKIRFGDRVVNTSSTSGLGGSLGATGATGVAGVRGENGTFGPDGEINNGATGATGPTGVAGDASNVVGESGATGASGNAGITGTNGAVGVAGGGLGTSQIWIKRTSSERTINTWYQNTTAKPIMIYLKWINPLKNTEFYINSSATVSEFKYPVSFPAVALHLVPTNKTDSVSIIVPAFYWYAVGNSTNNTFPNHWSELV